MTADPQTPVLAGVHLKPRGPRRLVYHSDPSNTTRHLSHPVAQPEELRRIVRGEFLAISNFFPEDDEANAEAIREVGLSPLLFRRSTLEHFAAAGWQVEMANVCMGASIPTPRSVLLDGAGVDALPVAETVLEWCVLVAS